MKRRRLRLWAAAAALLVLLLLAAEFTGVSLSQFWSRRSHLTDIVVRMIPPAWNYIPRILAPLWVTIEMSVVGTVLGSLMALFTAPLCAANLRGSAALRHLLRSLIQILRAFPALILALAATFVLGLGAFAGTAALTLYTFAIMTRLTYEDIESAPIGPYQALCAMGAGRGRAWVRGLLPAVAPSYLTNVLYLLETNVRHSAILGYVGAGGIGILLNEKISWQEYDRVASILLGLFVAVCVIELLASWLTALVRGERRISERGKRLLLVSIALLFLFCLVSVGAPDFSRTSPGTVGRMLLGLVRPDWAFMMKGGKNGLVWLLLETLCIAFVGTVAGAVFSFPLALLGSGRLMPRPVAAFFRTLTLLIRTVPYLIYGLIFVRVTGNGAFTGVLTMAVCSIGLLTKRFIEAIDTLDMRPYRALAAMGVSPLLCMRHALLPQLLSSFASAVLYRFDVNTREAAVLGLVGAGGIGAPLIFAMNQYNWPRAGAVSLGLILLVWLIDLLSARLRRRHS
ncbi:MAG: phosphonate ABC transporter, permease protein PhnE [Oscillospiraceae bacterium]|nr:phosphonate ABC transporter, permease protein PhnE [Oscillospiraceae bacterium]